MGFSRAELAVHVIGEITAKMKLEGYSVSDPPDGGPSEEPGVRVPTWRRVWFTIQGRGIEGRTVAAVEALVSDSERTGGVRFQGMVNLLSPAVEEVLFDIPDSALDSSFRPGNEYAQRNLLDMNSFAGLKDPSSLDRDFHVIDYGVGDGVDRFMECVTGEVAAFLAARDSVDKLVGLALRPRETDPGWPSPSRFRGVVVLCLLDDRVGDAVGLMDRYLLWERYKRSDSRERVQAFDSALRQRFPEYALARSR
ncbi:hypothetical protein [Nocardia jiangsuensis]|uniref:Uncharacterized protein n=1 Tax=Nocardia jiangsuensis TaxID=1691563 RepID=A0ABV8DTQ4_9NOCA